MIAAPPKSQPDTATAHTPTPWVADPDWREGYSWNIHIIEAANPNMRICFMTSDGPAQENADLIVEAVNSHASLKARIEELEGALQPFAKTGWMTGEIEHTDRTIIAHMHPEREREIILSSDDFKRARDLLNQKGAV